MQLSSPFRLVVLAVFIAVVSSRADAQSIAWTPLDRPAGVSNAVDLEIAPSGDLYLLTYDGIYCSTDDGVSWRACPFIYPSGFLVYDIAVDSVGNILAGGHGGSGRTFYMSTDRGANWAPVNGYSGSSAAAVAVGPEGTWYVGGPGATPLQRSTDNGATWTPLRPRGIATQAINALPSGTLLARGGSTTFNGLWRSTDEGETWDSLHVEGHLHGFRSLSGDTVIAIRSTVSGVAGRLVRSLDNGMNWAQVNTSGAIIGIIDIIVRSRGDIILSMLGNGFFTSTDRLRTWTHTMPEELPNSLSTIVETADRELVAAGPTGPYRSDDGLVWQTSYQGLNEFALRSLFDPGSASLVGYADWGGVVRSDDRGESWRHLGFDAQFYSVRQMAPLGDGGIVVLTSSGIYVQPDSGRIVASSAPPNGLPDRIATVSYGDTLYLVAARVRARSYVSADTGKTWRPIDSLTTGNLVDFNGMATAADGVIYMSTTDGLFRARAPEFTFAKVADGPGMSGLMGVAANSGGMVLAASSDMLWRSMDNGMTWDAFDRIDGDNFLAFAISATGDMLVSTATGTIHLRRPTASGWRDVSGVLEGENVYHLLLHNDGSIYALITGSRIYRGSLETASVAGTGASSTGKLTAEPSVTSGNIVLHLATDVADSWRIAVHDVRGEIVASHRTGRLNAGEHSIALDLSRLPAGHYWCRAVSGMVTVQCAVQIVR